MALWLIKYNIINLNGINLSQNKFSVVEHEVVQFFIYIALIDKYVWTRFLSFVH